MKLNGNYVCSIRRYMFGQFKPILCGKHIMFCKQLLENWYGLGFVALCMIASIWDSFSNGYIQTVSYKTSERG